MPCPHNEITIVQRSQRQSAVAAAAYQSGEKLFCEYDQQVKHYPEKRGIVHNEILLPPNAPQEYADRNTLWNAAEAVEKQWNSQLARRWVLTIPREIPPDQYAVLVREFCQKQFVSKGMIADFAIHDPHPPGHNPHAHVMLTTPKGNATLVDDYGGNKQLITVTTKSGNYFYILIDRAAEGEQTVHFLNQVDEADLMALTENGEAAKKPEICNCTEKCEAGKVNTSCPVCVASMTGCTGKEPTPTPTEQPEEPKEKGGNPGVVLALVLFALLGGGAAFYYFKFLKPKQNVKGDTDLEDFEFEDYDEDEPEADTGETPEDKETEEETL